MVQLANAYVERKRQMWHVRAQKWQWSLQRYERCYHTRYAARLYRSQLSERGWTWQFSVQKVELSPC